MKKIFTFSVLLSIIGWSGILAQTEKIFFSMGPGLYSDREIFSINPDGTGLTTLINWPGYAVRHPRLSPDGKKIAFQSNKNSTDSTIFQVWVANVDGSNALQLTTAQNVTRACNRLLWDFNSIYIYFDDYTGYTDSRICKIRYDGTGFQEVIDHIGSCQFDLTGDINPVDTAKLLYVQDYCWSPTSNTYIYDLQSQSETQILDGNVINADHSCYRWSPDGNKILFFMSVTSGHLNNGWGLNIMNADGSDIHSITPITGTEGYFYCDWSPDGNKIASTYFESDPDAAHYLYVMDNDGSNPTQIYYNASENIDGVDWGVINENSDCLVAYYPFNGDANDESGNAYNGTVMGATLSTDRFGNPNKAYSFDSTGNYIEAYDLPVLDIRFSYSAWIKVNDDGEIDKNNNFGSYGTDNNGLDTWDFGYNVKYKRFAVFDFTNNVYNTSIDIGKYWTHVVVVYNCTTRYLYVNNNMINQESITTPITLNGVGTNLRIGAHLNGALQEFEGSIDDVKIFNCALTPEEIDSLYHEGLGIKEAETRNISIYPNPADDHIIIENATSNIIDGIISIYNIQGQLILQKPILNVMTNIDISMLTKSVYIVKISSEGGIVVRKFVKD